MTWTKLAIFNKYRGKMSPYLWDGLRLKPEVRDYIVSRARKQFPDLKAVYMLGSLTTPRWSRTSDVDITIALPALSESQGKTHGTEAISGKKIPGTPHLLSYYLVEWTPELHSGYLRADTNVYDLLADSWVDEYEQVAPTRPVDELFPTAKEVSDQQNRIISDLVQKYSRSTDFNRALIGSTLLKQLDRSQQERRDNYSTGFGIPRYSEDNYYFKSLANGPESRAVDAFLKLRSKLYPRSKAQTVKQLYG